MGLFGKDRYIDRPVIVREKETEFVDRNVTQNVTVTEIRAPTAESARLLKDLEAEAQQRLLDRIRLTDNGFECVIHTHIDSMNDETVYLAQYKLNGRTGKTEHREYGVHTGMTEARLEHFERLRDAVATDLAAQILAPAFNAAIRG